MHGRPAHRHPARRQEKREDAVLDNSESLAIVVERNAANNDGGVATVFSVVYVTASATFSGPTAGFVTQGLPTSSSAAAKTSTKSDDDDDATTTKASGTSKTASSATSTASAKTTATVSPSASKSSVSSISDTASASHTSSAASSSVASTSASLSSTSSVASAAQAKATTSSTAAAVSTSSSGSGLSSGAKGGIAFAFLLAIGCCLGLAFFCIRRKKEKRRGAQRLADLENEKRAPVPAPAAAYIAPSAAPPPAPVPEPAPSIRSNSPAPRLTIRPTSRFSLGADPEKTAAGIVAAGASIEADKAKPSPWERRSHSVNPNADPANPFGIHAETVNNAPTNMPEASTSVTSFELQGSPVPFSPRLSNVPAGAAAAVAEPNSASSEHAPSSVDPMSPTKAEFGTASAVPVTATAGAAANAASSPRPLGSMVHRVQLEFMPTRDDELELKPGSLVRLLHEYDDGWALCMTMDRTKQGVAPRTCMSKLPLKPRPIGPPNGRPMSPMGHAPPAKQGGRKASVQLPRPNTHNSLVPAPLTPAVNGSPRQRTASGPQQQPRARSPGPNSSAPMADSRRRSASVGNGNSPTKPTSPTGPSPLNPLAMSAVPSRKPVPGQAM